MAGPDLSVIVSGHREGRLAVASLRSMQAAVAAATSAGISVQPILVLDRPDDLTRRVFKAHADGATIEVEVDAGDQGVARNAAVAQSDGRWIAMLDADDLFQESWLVRASRFLDEIGDAGVIAHPEFNYFFEGQATIFRQIDQDSPDFDIDHIRLHNYWDALAMCDRSIHEAHPYALRDIQNGWAFEDWHFNVVTLGNGIRHKVVPDTVIFKRRQKDSQTLRATGNRSRFRRTPMASYSHPIYKHFT
ncbi:glycosyltransferase family 2 protein [Paracoccus sp. TK19116]|uniref:Glycosyltransferase family 2 protein n=1 Tax=Paracoccus albicereus TaxID=2922394 RepID=A0ABT1MSE8_9RHOB|nr:glycosyltransferase family A protein [Paracoccus albicereus]MCQ0971234.1 glycosyltransferase family 2 protein [Paracoccus albicereus]